MSALINRFAQRKFDLVPASECAQYGHLTVVGCPVRREDILRNFSGSPARNRCERQRSLAVADVAIITAQRNGKLGSGGSKQRGVCEIQRAGFRAGWILSVKLNGGAAPARAVIDGSAVRPK